jgi:hypothetical protein
MRIWLVILAALTLAACEPEDQRLADYRAYRLERTLMRVCRDGTKIWEWRGTLYVSDGRAYPDAKVSVPLSEVC